MSVYQIGSFSFTRSEVDYTVDMFIETSTGVISATGFTSGLVTETERGLPAGVLFNGKELDGGGFAETYSQFTYPYAYAEIVEVDPNPPQCDLTLNVSSTNETSQGADDGTATVSAESTFDDVEVSINGIDWFSSPHNFSGLTPNQYTAQSRDSNGCARSLLFTIEEFANPITSRPEILLSPGNISRWNAAFNPIVFTFNNTPDPFKANYRIEIEITTEYGIVVGQWSPNTAGFTRADISAYLQSLVNAKDNFKYDVLNWRDMDRAASFTVRYRGVWDSDITVWYDAPQPYYVTWSAMQLGDKYGGNMAEYVPFLNSSFRAKWLTLFKEPTFNAGYPFDLSFIFSEYIIGSIVKMRTISLDINRQPIGGSTIDSFILNNDAGYILNTDTSRLIIQQGALPPVSNDGILEQLGINRLMMAGNPADGVEYFQVQLYTGDDEDPQFITEAKVIKVNKPCNDPFIYLKWLNTLGGWDYFRFGHDQVISLNTSDGISIDRNVFDWANDETIADTITKNAVKRISFGATVSDLKLDGLLGLHKSTHIMLQVGFNPIKFHTVTLGVGGFEIKRTKANTAELRFQISLPEVNIQRQ